MYVYLRALIFLCVPLQLDTVDAEIVVCLVNNPKRKCFLPLKNGELFSHTCFSHCQESVPCPHSLSSRPVHLYIFPTPFATELLLAVVVFHAVPQNKIGHPIRHHNRLLSASGM